jgi:hypothetical protein
MVLPPVGVLVFLFCLVAPENFTKSGKLDASGIFTLAALGVATVMMTIRFFA